MAAVVAAESVLPKTDPNIQRSFWCDELDDLKKDSIECTNNWKSLGCPRDGPIFECRKKCHYAYKLELRREKKLRTRLPLKTFNTD